MSLKLKPVSEQELHKWAKDNVAILLWYASNQDLSPGAEARAVEAFSKVEIAYDNEDLRIILFLLFKAQPERHISVNEVQERSPIVREAAVYTLANYLFGNAKIPNKIWEYETKPIVADLSALKKSAGPILSNVFDDVIKEIVEHTEKIKSHMICDNCNSEDIFSQITEQKFNYGIDEAPVELTAISRVWRCRACDYSYTDYEGEEARQNAVDVYLNSKNV
jgi:hypothetical protein